MSILGFFKKKKLNAPAKPELQAEVKFRIFDKKELPTQETQRATVSPPREFPQGAMVCPYCKHDLSSRKRPMRRSQFKCPSCSKKVYVDPRQIIYPSPYLTDTQDTFAWYLWQLNRWVFTKGSDADYLRRKEDLARRFHCEPAVADILWGLMNESMVETCTDEIDREMVRDLMKEFRQFVKKVKAKKD